MPVYILPKEVVFPSIELCDEDGLLAIGGDLSPSRLLKAYSSGIFPWFEENEVIQWWAPDPRMVLIPSEIKVSKSMKSLFKKKKFRVTVNTDFEKIITSCAKQKRKDQMGTWITKEMISAYIHFHELSYAFSVEVWDNKTIVAGLYGVKIGSAFFGESMFTTVPNGSKFGFICLVKKLEELGVNLIDCQVHTKHLESLGARLIPRKDFLATMKKEVKSDLGDFPTGLLPLPSF